MLFKRNNKILIFIFLIIIFIFFLSGLYYFKKNKCLNISNNLFNYFKLNFTCFYTNQVTEGEFIYSIQDNYSDYFRYTSIINKQKFECGRNKKLILVIGQSNAANEVRSFLYKSNNLNLYNGSCYLLSNPTLGATGGKDNISVAISNYLNNNKYIFLTLAWSGSSILEWGSDKFSYLSSEINKQLNYIKKNIDIIIWIQGETDAKLFEKLDVEQGPMFFQKNGRENFYIKAFENIIDNLKLYINENTKIILTKTSICDSKRSKLINAQQVKIANSSKNFFIIENTDNLNNNYRYDRCHLNEIGVDTTAKTIAELINLF